MTLTKRYVFAVIPLFSEAVGLYSALVVLSDASAGTAVSLSFSVYLFCLLACVFINALLCLRERSLIFVVACNALAAILTTALVMLSPHTLAGAGMYISVGFICLYLAPRSAYYIRCPITADKMLTHCEMSVFGTAFLLLLQFREPRPYIILLCFAAIAFNLIALSSIRIMRSRQSGAQMPGIQRGFILTVAGAGAFIAATFLGIMLLPALRDVIVATVQAIVQAVVAVARFIERLLLLLFQLLPARELGGEMPPIDAVPIPSPQVAEEYVELPPAILYAVLALLSAGGIAIAAYVLYKVRRLRLRAATPNLAITKEKSRVPSFFSILLSALSRLYEKLAFSVRLLVRFNTVVGVFVRLERRSKRYGNQRRPSEPPREFLMRVCGNMVQNNTETHKAFLQLADQIDLICFSPAPATNPRIERARRKMLLSCAKFRRPKLQIT